MTNVLCERVYERHGIYIPQFQAQTGTVRHSFCCNLLMLQCPTKLSDNDREGIIAQMEIGHTVTKIEKRSHNWDPTLRTIQYNREARQIFLLRNEKNSTSETTSQSSVCLICVAFLTPLVDIRTVKEIHTSKHKHAFIRNTNLVKNVHMFDQGMILIIMYGDGFVLQSWMLLCALNIPFFTAISPTVESADVATLWIRGLNCVLSDTICLSHPMLIESWLRKQFYTLAPRGASKLCVSFEIN
jgi:hypothetical protein